jgi:hypothetical protein
MVNPRLRIGLRRDSGFSARHQWPWQFVIIDDGSGFWKSLKW